MGQTTSTGEGLLTLLKDRETHVAGGVRDTQHGVRFQLKVVYFFIYRALQLGYNEKGFKIATEYSDAGNFDDLVFFFDENGESKYRCLQMKHKRDESKLITLTQLFKTDKRENKDFYLPKYFESYRKIKKNTNKNRDFASSTLKDLIIVTNIGFDDNDVFPPDVQSQSKQLKLKEYNFFDETYDEFMGNKLYKFQNSFPGREIIVNILLKSQSMNIDKVELSEVDGFLEHLRFAVNYPNEKRLSEMINKLLAEHFQLKHIDFVSDHILRFMWDWLSDKSGTFLNEVDAKYLIDYADGLGCKYKLTGLTETYITKLKEFNITLSGSLIDLDSFLKSNKQVLNIVSPQDTMISVFNVLQLLLNKRKERDDFVFLPIEDIMLNKQTILKSFKLPTETLLVINLNQDKDKSYLIYNTVRDILDLDSKKKIIMLTKSDENIIEEMIKEKYEKMYEFLEVDFTEYLSLSENSINILLDKNVWFQAQEMKLSDILPSDRNIIKRLISEEFLINLITKPNIFIGNDIQNLGEVNEYFIERHFERSDIKCDFKIILELEEKCILLSADAGMGKSTILTQIGQNLKQDVPSLWITRVNLNDYSDELQKSNFNCLEDCISFLIKTENFKTNFENELYKALFKENDRIVVLLDGYDEISPVHNEQVTKLTKILKTTKIAQVWLTTRTHLTNELEKELGVTAFKLVPLSQDEQNIFFSKFWTSHIDIIPDNMERMKCFQRKLLELVSAVFFDFGNFTEIPLQLVILSEAYIDDLDEFLMSDDEDPYLQDDLNIITLFERFVNRKFRVYSKEKAKHGGTVAANEDIEKLKNLFVDKHKTASVFTLIDPLYLERIIYTEEEDKYFKFVKEVENGSERTGIINGIVLQSESKRKMKFMHRTFTEYFLALWFADKVGNVNRRDTRVLEFMRDNFFKFEYIISRKFFDFIWTSNEQTKLHSAIINNNFSQVQNILEQSSVVSDIESSVASRTDKQGRTALHLAIMYKHETTVNFLLDQKIDLNIKDSLFGWSAVQCACYLQLYGIVEKCIMRGCYTDDLFNMRLPNRLLMVQAPLKYNYSNFAAVIRNEILKPVTPFLNDSDERKVMNGIVVAALNLAAKFGYLNVVEYLMKLILVCHLTHHCADWRDAYDSSENTALHLAIQGGHEEIVKHFIDLLNEKNINKETAILTAVRYNQLNICKYLIEKGAKVNDENINLETPLHYAAKFGFVDLAKCLVENKAQKDSRDKFGYRPIHFAAANGHLQVVRFLVESGADKNARLRQQNEKSPIHLAVENGHQDIYSYLIEQGTDPKPNKLGRNLLHFAASGDQIKMVEYLLKNNICELESLDNTKYSALNLAAKLGKINVLRYLRSLDANTESKNKYGETAFFSAARKGRIEVIKYLVEEDVADIEAVNNDLQTPFHIAVVKNRAEVIKYLIDKVDVNTKDENLNTPLHTVMKNGVHMFEVAKLLIAATADVNAQTNEGNTPLHICYKYKSVNTVPIAEMFSELLLQNGAVDNIENNMNEIPKNCSEEEPLDDLFERIVESETEDEKELYCPLGP